MSNINLDDLLDEGTKSGTSLQPDTSRNWSPLQQAIFTAVQSTRDNILVQAVAGSGKTTTIVEGMKFAGSPTGTLFCAFNKAIAETLASKVPPGAAARTFNSLGHSVLYRMVGKASRLDSWKTYNLAKQETDESEQIKAIARAVDLAKHRAVGILVENSIEWFKDTMEDEILVEPEALEFCAAAASRVFDSSLDCSRVFDFNDQVYQPVFYSKNCYGGFDTIFVDEAQDLSPINHLSLGFANARIIAVGDRGQAIYAFRGADSSSMGTMKELFNMVEFPLSITYRCPLRVVEVAQRYVPDIQASDQAKPGRVSEIEALPRPQEFPEDSIVVCRNNAPLFAVGLEFLRERVPCRLMTNFGQELVKLIQRLDGITRRDAYVSLCRWRDEQLEKAKSDKRINAVIDRFECLAPFFTDERFKLRIQVVQALQSLLDSKYGVRICTIHKAKGLEAKHVYFEQPELLGDDGQEKNLYYVAVTRSLENLYFRRGEKSCQ